MSDTGRREIEIILRRLIAFNNKSQEEKVAFDAVGIGGCFEEAELQLASVKRAVKLSKKG